MKVQHTTDISISLTIIYLKIIGIWFAIDRKQKYLRNTMTVYTICSIISYVGMQFRGLYVAWNDISVSAICVFNSLAMCVSFLKLCLVLVRKEQFLQLIAIMQENFWHCNYDSDEQRLAENVKKLCFNLVCTFSFFSQLTMFCYSIKPALSSIGRNISERMLLFPLFLDPRYYDTPYYEIIYAIQVCHLYQCALCYQSFDNIFCIMCMHVAGQFRILQHRMINIHKLVNIHRNSDKLHNDASHSSDEYLDKFKNCIRQHQVFVEFCKTVNEVFTIVTLLQVLMFTVLVCLAGYQLFVLDLNLTTRVSVISLVLTNMVQLWMFTYSCNVMTQESLNVAEAAYASPWIHLPLNKCGKIMRMDLQFVIMRSSRPCYVTAYGFFPVSLETYTKIISSSMSYFTLLRQSTVDSIET